MHLKELLREELIVVDLKPRDKWKTIEKLVDVLINAQEVDSHNKNELLEALYERERRMTTGIENSVAIPHAASGVVNQITAALGVCESGLDFEAIDGQPTSLIVLLVYPPKALQEHIRTLASIANLLNEEATRTELKTCKSSAEALRIIQQE
ncbi:PTS sugar transporter subunit IIA [bacterium]|nr:PTS sugar transporter subunit IIA [bacterium]